MVTLMIQLQVATTVLFCGCDNGFQELGFFEHAAERFWSVLEKLRDFGVAEAGISTITSQL